MEKNSSWTQIKTKYKNLSLKRKLLTFYTVLFLLPLIMISLLIYNEVYQSMLSTIRFSAEQSYEQAKSYLEYKMLWMIQRTDVVVTSRVIRDSIMGVTPSELNSQEQVAQKEILRSYIQSVESSTQSIRIRLYIDDSFNLALDGNYIRPLSQAINSKWYEKKGNHKVYFSPTDDLEKEQQGNSISLVRDVYSDSDYSKSIAVLRMDINLSELEKILQNATPTGNSVTYLINSENRIVASSKIDEQKALGLDISLAQELFKCNYADNIILNEDKIGNETIYYIRNKIRNTDWDMITVIPKSDMVSGISKLQYMVAGLMVLFAILTITCGAFIVSWIVKRISNLIQSINQVKLGNMDIQLQTDAKDEIGVLCENFNDMVIRTRDLMDEKYKMGLSLKNAELKALQSQINPHFLYNTLDLINWLSYAKRNDEIHTTVIYISRYYRLVLNKGKDTLTLAQELQHVEYYVRIQSICFPNCIAYEEKVSEEIKNCVVPKIILQPLIENAIQHGIREKESKKGRLQITGELQSEGIVCIKIIDDGVGISQNVIEHILEQTDNNSQGGYGVNNVHSRLKLMFGDEYGLSYTSKQGVGTSVTVTFPYTQM